MPTRSGIRSLINMAEEMQAAAARVDIPEGVMELLDREYTQLPELMYALSKVWQILHTRYTDPQDGVPLPPAVMDAFLALQKYEQRGASAAEAIAPMAKKLCQRRINELADKRNDMWAPRANKGY